MPSIRLEVELDARRMRLFDVMADHARYDRFRPISSSELLCEGEQDRNGVGAVRRLKAGPIRFDEEITAYERPTRFDYLIVDVNIPLHHEGGSIRFEESATGTRVLWTSEFTLTLPLLGSVLAPLSAARLERSFRQMLTDATRIASSPDPQPSPA